MTRTSIIRSLALIVAFWQGGCDPKTSPPPPPKVDTGATKAAQAFFDALVEEDWTTAYAALDPDTKEWCNKEDFIKRAKKNLDKFGFKPTSVAASASETDDGEAAAIGNYRGVTGTSQKQFKDGVALRRIGDEWKVVLQKNFGADAAVPTGKAPSPARSK